MPGEVEMVERDKTQVTEQAGNVHAFLGPGSRITGKLVFEGPVRLEGQIEGEITAQDTLTIGESAAINAQVTGTAIVIHGHVTGEVTASRRLEIRAPAKLSGSISTPSLVIHEGAVFEGQCTMGSAQVARADKDGDRKVALFPKEKSPAEVAAIQGHVGLGK
jgi:cytoskeletal protein CcmA (bactofilin family)